MFHILSSGHRSHGRESTYLTRVDVDKWHAAKYPTDVSYTVVGTLYKYISNSICNEAVTWLQAALVIQKCYHGYCERLELAVQWAAAQCIQAAWRSSAARTSYRNTLRRIILVQARYCCATHTPSVPRSWQYLSRECVDSTEAVLCV